MPEQNVIDILAACGLFSDVEQSGFQRLCVMARICKFPKEYNIFCEGDPCPGVYIVGEGMVKIFRIGSGGKEHVLHMVGTGGTFAEVAAAGGFRCPASSQTVEPTTCALLPLGPFRKLLEDDHMFCLSVMSGISNWVQNLVGLMGNVVLRDAAGRVAEYLLSISSEPQGTVELPGLKRHTASHLNLTGETFSRVIRRLSQQGLISDTSGNQIKILDREGLRQIAKS